MIGELDSVRVTVAGLGPMGRGIARVFDAAGADVTVVDVDAKTTAGGLAKIVSEAEEDGSATRIVSSPSLAEAVAGAQLLIEAIVERHDVKAVFLREVRQAARPELIVASNTSSLSIGELGVAYGLPERVVGMHFFNPPQKMRLVEVVRAPQTSPEVVAQARAWVAALGKTAVLCSDSPNFIVNRICRPLYYEAQLLVTQGVEPAVVDAVARGALGHRMGPLELLDFTGLHTHLGSSETAHREFGDPRYRPIPRTRALVRAGATGRAAGRGYYDYELERPSAARERVVRTLTGTGERISLAGPGRSSLLHAEAVRAATGEGATLTLYSCPASCSADDVAAVRDLLVRGARVVVDSSHHGWLRELPPSAAWLRLHVGQVEPFAEVVNDPVAGIAPGPAAEALLGALACSSVDVLALPGLVADRLQHTMVNEAVTVVEEGTAEAADVDLALRLGMNHPLGPFQYLDAVGPVTVLSSMHGLLEGFGDPRYRAAALLVRRAAGAERAGSDLTERSLRLPI